MQILQLKQLTGCGALLLFFVAVLAAGCADNTSPVKPGDSSTKAAHNLPGIQFCTVPDPASPSSAFNIHRSEDRGKSGHWVRYQCKQACEDWRQCLVPAYADDNRELLRDGRQPESAKQGLAFVVDGLGGHIALNLEGDKTVFIHTGAGGTRYYIKPALKLERDSSARTVMMRWEKGYISPIVQAPFTSPISWGWYSRTSEEPTDIRSLNKRVASVMDWVHANISDARMFATLGCSMGTNATFGPVLWHGLDPIIDYQLFVGGPNMWDLNAQCKRRQYSEGYCDLDGSTQCRSDKDCRAVGNGAHCSVAGEYTTIDKLFEQLPNHMHVTEACDIRNSGESTGAYTPFDSSSMGYAEGADWEIDHPMDFLVNLGAEQGKSHLELGGDEYWALGHFPHVYNRIKPDTNKSWQAFPNSHHCGAMFNEAIDVLIDKMDL